MTSSLGKGNEPAQVQKLWATVCFVGFFVLFFLYVWVWVDPSLLYHGVGMPMDDELFTGLQFPYFSWSPRFFTGFLAYPGGPVEYLSRLLSQYYFYPWAGALILTVVAALLGLATNTFMIALAGVRVPLVSVIPGILVLILCNQYAHRLAMLIGILVAMLAACVYTRITHSHSLVRFAAFVALSGPLYYLVGGAYPLYAALCGVLELRRSQGQLLGLCYLLLGGALPYVFARYVCDDRLADACAYAGLFSLENSASLRGQSVVLGLYLFPPLAAVGVLLWRRMPWARLRSLRVKPSIELAVLLVAVALAVRLSFDNTNWTLLRVNRFARQQMWEQVLAEARGLRCQQVPYAIALHAVNRALYETGRLPYEMFSYPQNRLGFMLNWGMPSKFVNRVVKRVEPLEVVRAEIPDALETNSLHTLRYKLFFQMGDLNLQLGCVNEAEHEAHEALELLGGHPLILKRLALVNIVKGQTEAAKVFLCKLTSYPRYKAWAQDVLHHLQIDPLWSTNSEIEHLRSVMLVTEPAILSSVQSSLSALLCRNKSNRMAFEYKMASYLLNWQLQEFVGEIDRLNDFDYPDIPRHYQEAILLYEAISGQEVNLHNRQISPETRQAYQEFMKIFALFVAASDLQGAQEVLGQQFGDTYFFYYFFD